jgi:hypothetical protein
MAASMTIDLGRLLPAGALRHCCSHQRLERDHMLQQVPVLDAQESCRCTRVRAAEQSSVDRPSAGARGALMANNAATGYAWRPT